MKRDFIDQLLALAARQENLITIEQAALQNVTPSMLRAAADRGWLQRQRRSVYVVAGAGPSRWRPVVAAALVAGPKAAVSHSTAAERHKFAGVVSDGIELTIPGRSRTNLQGVTIHRSTTLRDGDVEERDGMRLTTPVRTLIDVADRFEEPLLGSILDEGAIARLWTVDAVSTQLGDAKRGVAGVWPLRQVVAQRLGEGHPHSKLEQRVIRVVKEAAPGYTLHHQVVLNGVVIEMDIAWVAQKLDGEVDGMAVRAVSRTKFEQERRRENILAAHGWRIVHFTAKMDDKTLIAQLAPFLGL